MKFVIVLLFLCAGLVFSADARVGVPDTDERVGVPDTDERVGVPDTDERIFRIKF